MQGADDIRAFRAQPVPVGPMSPAAYDPTWSSAFEPQNGTYAGRGVAFFKYTGSRGKSGANDASAEQMGYLTRMMDAAGVAWQIGELGRIDLGGGGTVATEVAHSGIAVVDIGVPVLSIALALRGGQQERPVHGLPCLQHLYRPQNSKHKRGAAPQGAAPFGLSWGRRAPAGRNNGWESSTKLIRFVKQEAVLSVAAVLAVVSAFFVPPDEAYLGYIDYRTLAILFS